MNPRLSELTELALALPPEERAALADMLISSFDSDAAAIEEAWTEESLRRLAQVESGEVELIDREVVLDEIRNMLRQ